MATLTVGDLTPRDQYTATSGQTVFTYSFPIFNDSDLKVYVGSTLKTLTTNYTVTAAGSSSGGTVVFGSGLTTGDIVTIYRDLPVARTTDYATGGALLAENLNDDLDKLVMMVQQLESDLNNRTLRFGQWTTGIPLSEFTESDTDRAGKVLGFDSSGNPNITQELGVFQGNWVTATPYGARDLVKDSSNNNVYFCVTAHTSTGTTPLSSNTDIAKWSLIVDAVSATSSASAAATSATASASSASAAATSKTGADTAKTGAETAKTGAETAKTAAETAKTASETAKTAAETAQTAAEAVYDSFDDRYLGTKTSDPTTDNDSNTLLDGALYFNTTNNVMMVYDLGGTTWNRTTPTSSDQTAINTVNTNITNITAVAGKATEIGLLGAAAAVADMAILATTDIVSDMNVLATADIVSDMNTLATADIVSDMNTLATADVVSDMNTLATADIVSDMNTLATADIVSDMNTLGTSTNVTNMNTLAGISANITSVAADATDIGVVAGKATEIGRLGTADAVSDMNMLATTDIVSDMNTLAVSDVITDMNVLATSDIVSDMNTLGTSTNVTNMATVASNLAAVNNFADTYRISATAPTTSLNEGDLYFDTATNRMRVYEGSAWTDVALSASSYVTKTGATASAQMPVGTEAQRDSTPAAGMFRYNSDTGDFEGYTTAWGAIAGGGGATTFPFYKADDTLDTIAITSAQFPFYKADGTLDNIGVS